MKTKVYKKEDLKEVAALIKQGELVAIMTDTVYGLAASSHNPALYQKLQLAKQRPADKPFPLMVANKEQIADLVEMGVIEHALVDVFMPGAVTFVFKRKENRFSFLNEQKTLGIRMADDPWVQALIQEIGHPIWLPSANVSAMPTATSSAMVLAQMDGAIAGVIDGNIEGGISSSVFDLTGPEVVCLREGIVTLDAIEKEALKWKE